MGEYLRGRILSSSVTIATTATAIPTTSLVGRRAIVIKNNGANIIYLGGSTVTTANGYPLAVNAEITLDLAEEVVIYGIVASSTENVRIIEGV